MRGRKNSTLRCFAIYVMITMLVLLVPASNVFSANETEVVDAAAQALIKKGRARGQGCTHCHGRYGIRKAAERAGMDASVGLFAERELLAYKSGARIHPTMSAISKTLSTEDIQAISAWLDSIR